MVETNSTSGLMYNLQRCSENVCRGLSDCILRGTLCIFVFIVWFRLMRLHKVYRFCMDKYNFRIYSRTHLRYRQNCSCEFCIKYHSRSNHYKITTKSGGTKDKGRETQKRTRNSDDRSSDEGSREKGSKSDTTPKPLTQTSKEDLKGILSKRLSHLNNCPLTSTCSTTNLLSPKPMPRKNTIPKVCSSKYQIFAPSSSVQMNRTSSQFRVDKNFSSSRLPATYLSNGNPSSYMAIPRRNPVSSTYASSNGLSYYTDRAKRDIGMTLTSPSLAVLNWPKSTPQVETRTRSAASDYSRKWASPNLETMSKSRSRSKSKSVSTTEGWRPKPRSRSRSKSVSKTGGLRSKSRSRSISRSRSRSRKNSAVRMNSTSLTRFTKVNGKTVSFPSWYRTTSHKYA